MKWQLFYLYLHTNNLAVCTTICRATEGEEKGGISFEREMASPPEIANEDFVSTKNHREDESQQPSVRSFCVSGRIDGGEEKEEDDYDFAQFDQELLVEAKRVAWCVAYK